MEYRQSKTAGDILGLIYASGFGIDLKESNYYYIEDARSYLLIDKVGKGIKEMEKFQIIQIREQVYMIKDRAGCCVDLVTGKEHALVFDTGCGIDDLYGEIRKITDLPLLVINSHGHYDHIGGNYQFEKVYLHKKDMNLLKWYEIRDTREKLLELGETSVEGHASFLQQPWGNVCCLDFDEFDLGELPCKIVELSGHTVGSIGILIPELRLLLAGDALLPVSCLIFPNHMSREDQLEMLKKVKELEFDYYVTGHYIEVYEKSMIDELIQCIEESFEKKAYSYHYPGPYHEPGKICVGDAARGIGLIY